MTNIDEEREEQRFRKELTDSNKASLAVAAHYQRKGCVTEVPKLEIRGHFDDRHDHADKGDVYVWKPPSTRRWIVEVKGRSFNFTDAESFGHDSIMLDRPNKKLQSDAYFTVSKDLNYAAVVLGSTRHHWYLKTVFDRTKGYETTAYFCPIQFANFIRLEK